MPAPLAFLVDLAIFIVCAIIGYLIVVWLAGLVVSMLGAPAELVKLCGVLWVLSCIGGFFYRGRFLPWRRTV